MDDGTILEIASTFLIKNFLELANVALTQFNTHASAGASKVSLFELSESTAVQASEDGTNGDPIVLLDYGRHEVNHSLRGLCLLTGTACCEWLWGADVLKGTELRMLSDNSRSLCKSNILLLQLSDLFILFFVLLSQSAQIFVIKVSCTGCATRSFRFLSCTNCLGGC